MNLKKIVCSCYNITNGMIKDAVEAGATTLDQVMDATKAGTACAVCLEDFQHVIDEFVGERK